MRQPGRDSTRHEPASFLTGDPRFTLTQQVCELCHYSRQIGFETRDQLADGLIGRQHARSWRRVRIFQVGHGSILRACGIWAVRSFLASRHGWLSHNDPLPQLQRVAPAETGH
jgi:hypothetical protein